jgi:hypothetical protein
MSGEQPHAPNCGRCGRPQAEHWGVNYADGPHVSGPVFICPSATFKAGNAELGLSIDMLDADRLRQYAQNLLTYGPDITHWASVPHVVSKLQTIATGIEKAVRDIGQLRVGATCAGRDEDR